MLRRLGVAGIVGTALVAAAAAFAPAAQAHSNVGFSVSIGAPGFAATVGNTPWAAGYVAPYYAPYYYRPYYAPAPIYPPVVYPAPYVARPVVVARPYYYHYHRPYYYRGW